MMWPKAVHFICRWVIGILFIWTGVTKLVYPDVFYANIMSYGFFGQNTANVIALVLPSLEIVLALSLCMGICRRGALIMSTVLLVSFTLLHTVVVSRGLEVSCGCFGGGANELISGWSIARNGVFTVIAIAGWMTVARISIQPTVTKSDSHALDAMEKPQFKTVVSQ